MFMEMRLERRMELFEMEEQRLAARAAAATVAAIAVGLVGVVAAAALRAGTSVAVQALSTAPLPLSVVAGAWAYGLRRRLGEIRGRKAETRSALEERSEEDPFGDLAPAPSASPADLLAIERILRIFYEAPSGSPAEKRWVPFRALFAPRALIETGRGGPSDPGIPVERYVALARLEAPGRVASRDDADAPRAGRRSGRAQLVRGTRAELGRAVPRRQRVPAQEGSRHVGDRGPHLEARGRGHDPPHPSRRPPGPGRRRAPPDRARVDRARAAP